MIELPEVLVRRTRASRASLALLSLVLLLAPISSARAQRAVSTTPGGGPELGAVSVEDGALHLTLDEAIELALARNLGLAIQRYSRAQARLGIQQAMGIYDLGLSATASARHTEDATTETIEGAEIREQDTQSYSLGLAQLFATGGTVEVGVTSGRLETNSRNAFINPSFDAGLDVAFRQPLLRNFGRDATEFGIAVSRLGSDESLRVFEEQLVATIQNVELAYWGVVEAQAQLEVAEESRRLARQLHENNRVRVDVGTLAPLEMVSSEAGIATREEELIRARADVGNAEDVLKSLLRVDGTEAWAAPVVPETDPATEFESVSLEQSLETALASRPEIERERVAQQSRDLEAAYYRAQTKPRLDLRLAYGYSGTGGNVLSRDADGNIIATIPGGLSDAFQQVVDNEFPTWSVGLEFGYPLQNRAARARAAIAELAAEQGEVGISQVEQLVITEVRLAVRAIETARQELESARVSVRLQTANLDAERKKFLNGLSTSFQILQVEEDLTAARSREVRAVTGYRRALVGYYRAIGRLLDRTGVTIADSE
jgi:outer membrane protein TolC